MAFACTLLRILSVPTNYVSYQSQNYASHKRHRYRTALLQYIWSVSVTACNMLLETEHSMTSLSLSRLSVNPVFSKSCNSTKTIYRLTVRASGEHQPRERYSTYRMPFSAAGKSEILQHSELSSPHGSRPTSGQC